MASSGSISVDYAVSSRSDGCCVWPKSYLILYSDLFRRVPTAIPLNPLIIPTYLHHSGSNDRTDPSIRLGGGWGWMDTLGPCVHPRSSWGFLLGICICYCGHGFCNSDILRNYPILHRHPTNRRVCGLRFHSAFVITCLSRDSFLLRLSYASKCALLFHTAPFSISGSSFIPLWLGHKGGGGRITIILGCTHLLNWTRFKSPCHPILSGTCGLPEIPD